jgi:ATP-dependent Zn protease
VNDAYQKSTRLIQEHLEFLHHMAKALLEKETLDSHDLDLIMGVAEPKKPEQAAENVPA